MSPKELNTLSYCESTDDGEIRPLMDDTQHAALETVFKIGTRIDDRYLLQANLGRGGMGRVFLAKDERLDRQVAMKVVANRQRGVDQELESALAKEAKLGAYLNHPGIATVFDFGFHGGKSFTVFEYVEGETLRQMITRMERIPLEETRRIVGALARALDFAHSQGIVHLDLKPENICAAANGHFKILDLGIARDFREASNVDLFNGTPAYSAPEQVNCGVTDGRTDQYALSLITYEMLSGDRAFEHANVQTLLHMQEHQPPPKISQCCPEMPPSVEAAILKSLAKEMDQRYTSCQEFAEALGCLSNAGDPPAPRENARHIYFSHAGDDSLAARTLAESLESRGYSTWYCQRDALPGVSFLAQTNEAIEHASATLMLISRTSLETHDFSREVSEAHRRHCPFLPVLVDLTSEEFVSRNPPWRTMLGSAAVVELSRNKVRETTDRLEQSLRVLNILPEENSRPVPGSPEPVLTGQAWATDANQIDISDLQKLVFHNNVIDDFLTRRNKHFISATKGLGKTLLLTYKRLLLTQEGQSELTLIPTGRPFLDFMSEMKSLSVRYEQPLSELNNTKRIWGAALRISAISHHSDVISSEEDFELEPFPRRIQHWLRGSRIEPTVVFKELTSLPISDINRLIDDTENFLDQKLRMIHSGTLCFIDKVDQAVRKLSRAAWINIQAGLIEAAWDLMNANSHIKVFATIRQEAFSNYESDIKTNLYGATTILHYSEEELNDLLDKLAQCYEGSASFREFAGLNVIKQHRQPYPEDSFQFIRRHTFGRPRDFVAIASEISANKTSLNEKRYCELVQRTSAAGLVSNVFDEMHVFLDCLQQREMRQRFLSQIHCNILSHQEAIELCAEFNGLPADSIRHLGEQSEHLFHPFRDLYLTGVLGVLVREPDRSVTLQKFKQPYDLVSEFAAELPESPFYLIHPALNQFIKQHRSNRDYQVFQHVILGEGMVWEPFFPLFCEVEKSMQNISDHELSESLHQFLKQLFVAFKHGSTQQVREIFGAASGWKKIEYQLQNGNHDDTLLWLDELRQMTW